VNEQVVVTPFKPVNVPVPVNVTTHCPANDGRDSKSRLRHINSGKRQLREHGHISSVRGLHVASRTAGGGCVKGSIRHSKGFVKRFAKLFLFAIGQV